MVSTSVIRPLVLHSAFELTFYCTCLIEVYIYYPLTERVDDESSVTGVEPRDKDVGDNEFWSVDASQDVYGYPDYHCQEHRKVTDDMTNLRGRGRGREGGREGEKEEGRDGGREGEREGEREGGREGGRRRGGQGE